ncbi:hypothetical protein BH10ACT3_BH10ACT3_17110 [soil metagenome]
MTLSAPVEQLDQLYEEPFAILTICTANVCRSPMAEHLLRHALREHIGRAAGVDWAVRSAGTHVTNGSTMHELAREALSERGISTEPAPARQATKAMLDRADLILTASRPQRAWIVERQPNSVRRVFTMRQFARLCAAGRAEGDGQPVRVGTDLMRRVAVGRMKLQPVAEEHDTIADPIGGDLREFQACARLIDDCIDQIFGPAD